MTSKKGVTLMILGIALVIMSIITGAVIVNAFGVTNKSKLSKFGESIRQIEDKVEEYYVLNAKWPILSGEEYNAQEIIDLNTLGYNNKLQREITKNQDDNSKFYVVDLPEIKINLSKKGQMNTQDDIYVVSNTTGRVYYLMGEKIGTEVYFSLAYIEDKTFIE